MRPQHKRDRQGAGAAEGTSSKRQTRSPREMGCPSGPSTNEMSLSRTTTCRGESE